MTPLSPTGFVPATEHLAEQSLVVTNELPVAAYVHVPFCIHRCGYCDFTVITRRDDLLNPYLTGLERELQHRLRETGPIPVQTLFIGGGTPTYLPPAELEQLLQLLGRWLPLAPGGEFTVEANPADLDAARCEILAAYGVNRVSLGVQSFDVDCLQMLERDHTPDQVERVVTLVRRFCRNLSFDLIFGIPGQTLSNWEQTLKQALQLGPEHLSTYGLTFEKGTPFWNRREKGELAQAEDDLELSQYELAQDLTASAGFEQYEISSCARPGYRCRHNQVYWTGLPYLGVGPGAASYLQQTRLTNHRSTTTWLRKVLAGESPITESECLAPRDRALEQLTLGLRRCEGVERDGFRQRTGFDWQALAGLEIDRFERLNLLEITDQNALRLTRSGRPVADAIFGELLTAECPPDDQT